MHCNFFSVNDILRAWKESEEIGQTVATDKKFVFQCYSAISISNPLTRRGDTERLTSNMMVYHKW